MKNLESEMRAGAMVVLLLTSMLPAGASCASGGLRNVDRPWTLEAPRKEVVEHVPGVYWIEAENFAGYGGWILDTQFAHKMGSGYLLAAGVGKPVADAATTVRIAVSGRYRVLARTKDWVPEHHPGRFAIMLNGRVVGGDLGASGRGWSWEAAGEVQLDAGEVEVRLVDRSGFYARCDAVVLVRGASMEFPDGGEALAEMRARCAGEPPEVADGGDYDVVVVGGGPAGVPAAIAAARHGAKTALVQDRPVLGGNISSELGVLLNGSSCKAGYREGGIIEEAVLAKAFEARGRLLSFSRVFDRMTAAETNLTVILGSRVYAAESGDGRISAALARDPLTGRRTRLKAKFFIDATGDGWLGYFAGAKYMYGRESASVFNESCAPDEADLLTMSGCLLGSYGKASFREVANAAPFKTPSWAWPLPEGFFRRPYGLRFMWWLEHPGTIDDCDDPELARDSLVRIFFAYWGWLRNTCPLKDVRSLAARHELVSIPYMNGRREGRRLEGDYIFTEEDAKNPKPHPDFVCHTGWPLDTHDPLGVDNPTSNGSWRKGSPGVPEPVGVPYRILYSKNIPNLFMAGRDVSCSHVGLGTLRVSATCAAMGQAVGTAAAGCVRTGLSPREYGKLRMVELQTTLMRDDQFIPGLEFFDPGNLLNGATASATSEEGDGTADKVLDGHARTLPAKLAPDGSRAWLDDEGDAIQLRKIVPRGESHEWISDSNERLPQAITVRMAKAARVSEIRVTFDSDFYIYPIWMHHNMPKTLVRDYVVEVCGEDGRWRSVADVRDNCRRLAVHRFAPVGAVAIRVTVNATYGDFSARIFRIAAW